MSSVTGADIGGTAGRGSSGSRNNNNKFSNIDIPETGNEFVGDSRNGYIDFGWDTFDEDEQLSKRAIELNNGRAAQMGILGLMVHEQLGGSIPIVGEM